jgi:hypothetical protein
MIVHYKLSTATSSSTSKLHGINISITISITIRATNSSIHLNHDLMKLPLVWVILKHILDIAIAIDKA